MQNRNDPAPDEGQAVDCFLAGRDYGHTAERLRVQFLNQHFGLSTARADLISSLAWGGLA